VHRRIVNARGKQLKKGADMLGHSRWSINRSMTPFGEVA